MRKIGIVGDGPTDRQIFSKFVESILLDTELISYELNRQSCRDAVDRYWKQADKENNYTLPGIPASDLQKEIFNILNAAFIDFENEVGIGEISNQDILLITTDSEKSLDRAETYFNDWSFSLSKLFIGAIEKFYNFKSQCGYSNQYIPLIVPLICFPSSEVFIAAAKGLEHYAKRPNELKLKLYGTENLRTLRDEDFAEKALNFLTHENIDKIFNCVPESRLTIQILSLAAIDIERRYSLDK